jgi:hypothetical protein
MTMVKQGARQMRPGLVTAGAVVLAVGVAMLLDSAEILAINAGQLIGPFVLIAIGGSMLAGAGSCRGGEDGAATEQVRHGRQRGMFGGLWMVGLGCWLLISETHMFGLTFGTSWPLLLILMGALIAIRGWR